MAGFQQLTIFRDMDFRGNASHSGNIKGNPSMEKVVFVDHFQGKALDTSNDWNSAGEASGAPTHEAPHIMVITTESGDNDEWTIATQLNYRGEYNSIFEVRARCDDVTGLQWYIGFNDAIVHAAKLAMAYAITTLDSQAVDSVGFLFDPEATTKNIFGVSVNTNTNGSIIDSGHAETSASWATYRLELRDNGSGNGNANAFYYLNTAGKEIDPVVDLIGMEVDAVPRGTPLCLYIGVMNFGAGADNLDVDYVKTWQDAQA